MIKLIILCKKIIEFLKKIMSRIENKFLFSICLLTFIHACFSFVSLFKYTLPKTAYIIGIFYFIPVVIIFILYHCSNFLFKNASGYTKVVTTTISTIMMTVVYSYFALTLSLVIFFSYVDYTDKVYTDINEYKQAKKTIVNKTEAAHFPSNIPSNAKDIKLYKTADWFSGSEYFSLSFEIDKKYIDNELNKHKFIETEGPYKKEEEYYYKSVRYFPTDELNLNKTGFKFYVIGKDDVKGQEYGIAVNDKTNRIIYYYECLD